MLNATSQCAVGDGRLIIGACACRWIRRAREPWLRERFDHRGSRGPLAHWRAPRVARVSPRGPVMGTACRRTPERLRILIDAIGPDVYPEITVSYDFLAQFFVFFATV